jgi:hypothetical protein
MLINYYQCMANAGELYENRKMMAIGDNIGEGRFLLHYKSWLGGGPVEQLDGVEGGEGQKGVVGQVLNLKGHVGCVLLQEGIHLLSALYLHAQPNRLIPPFLALSLHLLAILLLLLLLLLLLNRAFPFKRFFRVAAVRLNGMAALLFEDLGNDGPQLLVKGLLVPDSMCQHLLIDFEAHGVYGFLDFFSDKPELCIMGQIRFSAL